MKPLNQSGTKLAEKQVFWESVVWMKPFHVYQIFMHVLKAVEEKKSKVLESVRWSVMN